MRILNDDGSATWRAIPSHPEGRRKTGLPGASTKNTGDGAWLGATRASPARVFSKTGRLKSESDRSAGVFLLSPEGRKKRTAKTAEK
jgi:hypothetical protein